MKKDLLFFVLFFVLSMNTMSVAQTLGVRAGLNLSSVLVKDGGITYSDDYELLIGFHIGTAIEFPINDQFVIQTGLLFTSRGFKDEQEFAADIAGEISKRELKKSLYYLNMPLNGKIYVDAGSIRVYGLFGPYVGLGLFGKTKRRFEYGGNVDTYQSDVEWGDDGSQSDFKRLDFGLNFGAGIEIKSFQIGVNYGLGLANIAPDERFVGDNKNRVIQLALGYNFGRKGEY